MRTLTLVGAGPVGVAAARAAVDLAVVHGIAVIVDPDEGNRGRAMAELGGPGCADLPGCAALSELALVAFSSRLEPSLRAVEELIQRGANVITTCEELSAPSEAIRRRLGAAAMESGRVAIATGANPGFVMDRLPLVVAGGCAGIRSIEVIRRLDTRSRRGPLVAKTGRGLTIEEFAEQAEAGAVGHVGLEVSARLVAEGLGWFVGGEEETIAPVVVDGEVAGVHQTYRVTDEIGRKLRYDLTMAWGITDPVDVIGVDGEPPLRVEIPGGYHGDLGTTARVVRALQAVDTLAPGFYRPTDLPLAW